MEKDAGHRKQPPHSGEDRAQRTVDFINCTIFSEDEPYLALREFADQAMEVSDYIYMEIYYKSIRKNKFDYLTTYDYIWCWDTRLVLLFSTLSCSESCSAIYYREKQLRSSTYAKLMKLNHDYPYLIFCQGYSTSVNQSFRMCKF